ncbi:MAG: tetratricopeptide repeat protein [Proteobacteria bacterium]|nr:tetratricopeptide repeat protein [Pseudomonadota bacterium]
MSHNGKLAALLVLGLLVLWTASIATPFQEEGEDVVIGTYHKIPSKILNEERTLLVHLPRGYHSTSLDYPVFYLLYGDHVTTYFAEAVAVLDRLGPTGRIPEMILVALTNTDRYRDLLPLRPDGGPTGIENFVRFFQEELIPYVETRYRAKNYRVVMGPQAAANFAMYTLFEHPELFQAAIINHPFRWRGGRDLILQNAGDFLKSRQQFKKFLSITYEDGDELAREGVAYIDRFAALVHGLDIPGFRLHLNYIKDNDEFIQPMGLRIGLKVMFQDYPFPEDKEVNELGDILDFYQRLSTAYGFPVDAPEHVLSMQTYKLLDRGGRAEAVEVVKYMQKNFPQSANAYMIFANLYLQDGELEKARDSYKKMIEILPGDVGMIQGRIDMLERRIASSAAYVVEKEIRRAGIAAGLQKFRALRKAGQTEPYFDGREFNELGYRLLNIGEPAEAIEIFKLNVELYPESANVYDSLAEAYMKNGQKELAIRNYERSLELNPDNQNARDMLKRLRKIMQH